MKLQLSLAVAGHLLSGCSTPSDIDPPTVVEPVQGQVYDRVLARVRMTPPANTVGDNKQIVTAGDVAGLGHAEWRVNGGVPVEPGATTTTDIDTGYTFAVTLVPGDNLLELGRCNLVGECGWTAVDVSVELRPGSPDPSFASTGIAVHPPVSLMDTFADAQGVWPLADGRVLVAGSRVPVAMLTTPEPVLVAFRPDGLLDSSFGMYGVVELPTSAKGMHLIARADGSFDLVLRGQLARMSASGVIDTGFGTNGLAPITSTSASAALAIHRVREDGSGGFWVTGVTPPPPAATREFVLHVDSSGSELSYQELGDGSSIASSVTSSGQAAFVSTTRVLYSTGATVALPQPVNFGMPISVQHASNGDVLVAHNGTSATIHRVTGSAIAWSIGLPFVSTGDRAPLVAEAPAGAVYAVGAWDAPETSVECCRWYPDAPPSTEIGIVRIVGSSLDPTFGSSDGPGHASSALSWFPMTTERTLDVPGGLAIGPDGAPWVAAGAGTDVRDNGGYTVRGPGLMVAKFVK